MRFNYSLYLSLTIMALLFSGCGAETSAPASAQASASPGSNTSGQTQNNAKLQVPVIDTKPRKDEAGFKYFILVRICYPPVTQERYSLLVNFSNTFSSELTRELDGYTGERWTVYIELGADSDRQMNISLQRRPGARQIPVGVVQLPATITDDTIMDFSQHSAIGVAEDIRKVSKGGILPPTPRIY